MCKLIESPVMHKELFAQLYHTGPDVIFFRQGRNLNYSFPSMQDCIQASKDMMLIIKDNSLDLRLEITTAVLNFIIIVKPNL